MGRLANAGPVRSSSAWSLSHTQTPLLVTGVLLSFVLGAVALSLFLTACCSGMFAAGALMGE